MAVAGSNEVHGITSDIIKRHSSNIAVGDLKLQSMTTKGGSRKRGLNRSMQNQCLGMLIQQLAYKAESAAGELAKIKPHYTTQQCSSCGGMPAAPIGLGVRSYQCDQCGLVLERDINAARNIRLRGLRPFSRAAGPACRSEAADAANVVPMVASSEVVKHGYDTQLYRQ